MNRKTKKLLTGMAAGAAAGSLLAFLFAPKKGSEMRKDIANTTLQTVDKLKNTSNNVANNIKTTAVKTREKVQAAFTAGVDTYKREGEKIKSSTEILEEALTEENPNKI